jgi:hypothetical protein
LLWQLDRNCRGLRWWRCTWTALLMLLPHILLLLLVLLAGLVLLTLM